MELHGRCIIGTEEIRGRADLPRFQTFVLADGGFDVYRQKSAGERAAFLENIAAQIISLDDELLERASAETGLLTKRLRGERSHVRCSCSAVPVTIDEMPA